MVAKGTHVKGCWLVMGTNWRNIWHL